jgi:hypothetical protein
VSDHGQEDITRTVNLTRMLQQWGLDGMLSVQSNGMSAYFFPGRDYKGDADPAALLDISPLRQKVVATLEKISRKTKVEKSKVALLCYVTAQDIPITETAVLEELGTGKSRAYAIREKVMDLLKKELRNEKEADSPLFGRVLLEMVESELPGRLLAKIGDAA